MIVITDSNIVFSALLTPDGSIAQFFKEKSNIQFSAPDYVLEETFNHVERLAQSTNKSRKEIFAELKKITSKITIIPTSSIPKKFIFKAAEIVNDIDAEDAPFVALYLYTKHKIWTLDKVLINGLKKKGYDICVTTTELKKSLYKNN